MLFQNKFRFIGTFRKGSLKETATAASDQTIPVYGNKKRT